MKDFLSAILAAPDDDAPRLVYADALQADGDPLGELIAVQCEIARLGWNGERLFLDWIGDERADPRAIDDGRFAKLRRREAELFRKHGAKWWKPKAEIEMFRRGFVEHIGTDNGQTVAEVLPRAPLARSVRTTASYERYARTFFASTSLDRIREIWWVGPDTPSVAHFAQCQHLRELRQLIMQTAGGSPLETTLLASAPAFRNLEGLTIPGYRLDAEGITTVFAASKSLRELVTIESQMGAAGVEALVATGVLDHMRILALRHARLRAGEAMPLFTKGKGAKLEALDLRTNVLSSWDTATIADLPALRVLDLGNNPTLGAPGIEALVNAKGTGLKRLRSLALQKTGLDDRAVKALACSELFSRLRSLDLRGNQITDKGIRALVREGDATSLRVLYVSGNRCGPAGTKLLKTALPNTRIYS